MLRATSTLSQTPITTYHAISTHYQEPRSNPATAIMATIKSVQPRHMQPYCCQWASPSQHSQAGQPRAGVTHNSGQCLVQLQFPRAFDKPRAKHERNMVNAPFQPLCIPLPWSPFWGTGDRFVPLHTEINIVPLLPLLQAIWPSEPAMSWYHACSQPGSFRTS